MNDAARLAARFPVTETQVIIMHDLLGDWGVVESVLWVTNRCDVSGDQIIALLQALKGHSVPGKQ